MPIGQSRISICPTLCAHGRLPHFDLDLCTRLVGECGPEILAQRAPGAACGPAPSRSPLDYVNAVPLSDHQKAADYTLAKIRLSQWDIALDAALLLGWTLMGGLHALNQVLLDLMGPGMPQQVALVLSFVAVGGLLGLPLSLMQTFGVEQRFGFNKITPKLWLADMAKGLVLGLLVGTPLLWVVLWLMQAGGTLWWLWAWGVMVLWQLFLMAIAPM